MYVRTYVVGHAQEFHVECHYIPYDIGYICVHHSLTHSDTLDSDIDRGLLCSLAM